MTMYTIQEIEAIRVIRKSMLTKPEIINRVMRDAPKEMAMRVLVQAKDELAQLLEINRAFVAAASEIVKMEKNDGA